MNDFLNALFIDKEYLFSDLICYLVFIFLIIKFEKINNKKEIAHHIIAMVCFTFVAYIFYTGAEYFFSDYSILNLAIGLFFELFFYVVIMKYFTKKELYIIVIEQIYMQFLSFLNTIIVAFSAIFVLIMLDKQNITNENIDYPVAIIYSIVSIIIYIISYCTIGRKFFYLINLIKKNPKRRIINLFLFSFLFILGMICIFFLGYVNSEIDTMLRITFVTFFILTILAFGIVVVIEKTKNYDELEDSASKDELTGVLNRKFGIKYIENIITKNQGFLLCYLDIDNLKVINDENGHALGDIYICYIVNSIKNNIEKDDVIIRLGGDEFAIISKSFTKESFENIMEITLLKINENVPKELSNYDISFSYGIVLCEEFAQNKNIVEIIEAADKKMYEQKKQNKKERQVLGAE